MKTYFVTLNAVRLLNEEFANVSGKVANIDLCKPVECECVSEAEDGVVLKVPEMFGLNEVIIRIPINETETVIDPDSRCYPSITELKRAILAHRARKLVDQINSLVKSDSFDYERVPRYDIAADLFMAAYYDLFKHKEDRHA